MYTMTEIQFQAFQNAYEYFNYHLFDDKLNPVILNFSRNKKSHGFVAPYRWGNLTPTGSVEEEFTSDDFVVHELTLTPTTLARIPILVYSTLVHEQCHIWQIDYGKPSRNGYHNKEWANKMESVGLIPSNTGEPGGSRTGQKMTHYIESGGKYEKAFNAMPKEYILPFIAADGVLASDKSPKKSRSKTCFICPSCGDKAWGKPNLRILCGTCDVPFEPKQ